jgi:hypothetical protein
MGLSVAAFHVAENRLERKLVSRCPYVKGFTDSEQKRIA